MMIHISDEQLLAYWISQCSQRMNSANNDKKVGVCTQAFSRCYAWECAVSKLLELCHTQQDMLASSVEFSTNLIPCVSCKTGFQMCTFLYIKGLSIHSSSFVCSQLLAGQ